VLYFQLGSTVGKIVAGNETAGSDNNQLNSPYGVFVNLSGIIYIVDFLTELCDTNSG
jgi:hypothetical protein